MSANSTHLTKDLKRFQSPAQRKMIRMCNDCSVGLVVVYVCKEHEKECIENE